MSDIKEFAETKLEEAFNEKRPEAEEMLKDPDKVEAFLQHLEEKLKLVPKVGDKLAIVPTMISLVRHYIKKEYTEIPLGSIIAIVTALIYVLAPIDLIPDNIPVIGYADDIAVIAFCLKMVQSDVDDYNKWRKEQGLEV